VRNPGNLATVFDVAALAGVSIKTVSRVINHEPNVRAATQQRVEHAIAKLEYQPSEAARHLASQRNFKLCEGDRPAERFSRST